MAVPVVTNGFNIINWKLFEIKKLDTKIRKWLTIGQMHHAKADVDRLYLPRARGGRGVSQVELSHKTTTIGLATYLTSTNDSLLHIVQQRESISKRLYSIPKEAAKFKKELDLKELQLEDDEAGAQYAKRIKTGKTPGLQQTQNRWEKALHGRYPAWIKEADVDTKATNQWLKYPVSRPKQKVL